MNFAKFSKELTPAANTKQLQEITSIRRKAKVLQEDIESVIRAISELSEIENIKVKVRSESKDCQRIVWNLFS